MIITNPQSHIPINAMLNQREPPLKKTLRLTKTLRLPRIIPNILHNPIQTIKRLNIIPDTINLIPGTPPRNIRRKTPTPQPLLQLITNINNRNILINILSHPIHHILSLIPNPITKINIHNIIKLNTPLPTHQEHRSTILTTTIRSNMILTHKRITPRKTFNEKKIKARPQPQHQEPAEPTSTGPHQENPSHPTTHQHQTAQGPPTKPQATPDNDQTRQPHPSQYQQTSHDNPDALQTTQPAET